MNEIQFLRNMLRIRRLEEKSAELYGATKIRGYLHLYIGEEAIAAGAMPVFSPEDAIVTTYREHGHALLRGISARAIMAEMFGKLGGCSRGRGGSMHLFDAKTRFFGGNAIVAGGLPIAVGLALSDRMQSRSGVTACFFGDGAVAEGEFHESMNLASLWRLPVIFLCENNGYAMGTALSRHQAQTNLAKKAESYQMPATQVDGMDVLSVHREVKRAYADVKEGKGPQFLELCTYRFRAHSMFDPELYRAKEEVAEWKKRDSIELLKIRLLTEKRVSEGEIAKLEAEVAREIDDAIIFAEASEWESISDLEKFVYSEGKKP
jgi:pyruvate dehydrogenase E1 component alpha subunit